jgi:hypothetical protein
MNADASGPASEPGATQGQGPGQPSEEELRAAYEAELGRITSTDMIAQAAVSLLNIGARRLGVADRGTPEPGGPATGDSGRDLDQVRDAIDAVRVLLDILERRIAPQELRSLRDALSQLQMAYAREVQTTEAAGAQPPGEAGAAPPSGGPQAPAEGEDQGPAGPAQSSGRLWVPGR